MAAHVETNSRAVRAVVGIDGSFAEDWRYSANFTTSEIGLQRTEGNYLIPQRIMDVAARGTFNFIGSRTPRRRTSGTTSAPSASRYSPSRLWQVQGTIAKDLFELPGGSMQAAVGASYREESIDAPERQPGERLRAVHPLLLDQRRRHCG